MVVLGQFSLHSVSGLQEGHDIDKLPHCRPIGVVGHTWFAFPRDLVSWIAGKLMPELIPRINNRSHQVAVRDWLVNSAAKHDWNASLGGTSRQIRAHYFMTFVPPERQKGRITSFDIAIRR